MSLDVGSRLGHYDVTALIGEGGMGQVYQATDSMTLGRVWLRQNLLLRRGNAATCVACRLAVALVVLFGLSVTSATAQNFEPPERIPFDLGVDSTGEPRFFSSPFVGDMNGDGFDDVVFIVASGSDAFRVTHNEPRPSLVILLNNRRGSFRNGTRDLIAGSPKVDWSAQTLHLEDFNGDGRPDVFACNLGLDLGGNPRARGGQNQLFLSRPNKKLRNVSRTHLPQVWDFCHGSSAADVDLDGDIDIWVNNLGGIRGPMAFYSSYLMLNDGQGVFEIVAGNGGHTNNEDQKIGPNGRLPDELVIVPGQQGGGNGFWSQFIDADNDGDPDLYLGYSEGSDRTWLLLNDGTGRFTDAGRNAIPRRPFRGKAFAAGSAVADLNGDGRDDLLLFDTDSVLLEGRPGPCQGQFGDFFPTLVSLLISNGDGTFRDETKMRTGQTESCQNQQTASAFLIGDMNGDGAVDFFVKGHERIVFYRNNGRGQFTRLPDNTSRINPNLTHIGADLVAVDVNNDGASDFVEGWEIGLFGLRVIRSIHPNPGARQCAGRPTPPRSLAGLLNGGRLTLKWQRPLIGIPARYRIKAGTAPGRSDVVNVVTADDTRVYRTFVNQGDYYVRVHAINPCGKQGQVSHQVKVTRATGPMPGIPNPVVSGANRLLTTDTADNLLIFGAVENAWQAGVASFVEVVASLFGQGGRLLGTESTFVSGRSRRVMGSRLVTDTTLGTGESGCFVLFTDIPRNQVKRVKLETVFEDVPTEKLLGKVKRVGNLVRENAGGKLRVRGTLRNRGRVPTFFNQLTVDVRNRNGRVIDCDGAFAMGSSVTLPSGRTTETGLAPGERGPFQSKTRASFGQVETIDNWVTWDEEDPAGESADAETASDPQTAALMREYQTLRDEMAMLAGTDPEVVTQRGRAEIRERLAAQVRQIEKAVSQP